MSISRNCFCVFNLLISSSQILTANAKHIPHTFCCCCVCVWFVLFVKRRDLTPNFVISFCFGCGKTKIFFFCEFFSRFPLCDCVCIVFLYKKKKWQEITGFCCCIPLNIVVFKKIHLKAKQNTTIIFSFLGGFYFLLSFFRSSDWR